jgi:hypothetical protein
VQTSNIHLVQIIGIHNSPGFGCCPVEHIRQHGGIPVTPWAAKQSYNVHGITSVLILSEFFYGTCSGFWVHRRCWCFVVSLNHDGKISSEKQKNKN